ncbi:myb-related transcription factor, partner of profilin-like [Ambystoma mexicanum]|uniref:myb-related transcription factor, partner of profilin-like n=1 Tax=Ambystoma mexicanum TaxID=8296 RepID=UPI0037E84559
MPKAIKKAADRQRMEKFTNEELIMLTETLAANADVVFAIDMRRETLIKKKAIWAEVAQKVSAVGKTTRTVKDCRKRWDDLHLRVRSILSTNRSQTDSDEQDTATQAPPAKKQARAQETGNTATTSRGTGRSEHLQRGKHSKRATAPRPEATAATIAAPTAVIPPTQETPTEDPLSAATSSTGEATATAPLSDVEEAKEASDLPMQMQTPSPTGSREASPRPTPRSSSHGQSGDETMAGCWSPQDIHQGAAATPRAGHSGHDLATIRQRQEDITALVG